jgi:hypothetical protein
MDHKNMETLDEKLAAGRALRKQANRQSHREIGNVDRVRMPTTSCSPQCCPPKPNPISAQI